MNDLIPRFTSRKFLLAVFGAITVIVLPRLGIELSTAELTAMTVMVTAFIGVEGLADTVTRTTNIPEIEDDKSEESKAKKQTKG